MNKEEFDPETMSEACPICFQRVVRKASNDKDSDRCELGHMWHVDRTSGDIIIDKEEEGIYDVPGPKLLTGLEKW